VTWSSGTWAALRLVGLPAKLATTMVGGVVLLAAALVWWVLVVEPRLFAPRPSIRPRVLPGPAQHPASVDDEAERAARAAVYLAAYAAKSRRVIDVEARPGPNGGGAR
jgi:hypothetical protein